ncbi:YdcH family protein [Yoonia sp. 2307UL14-13]|uniref:YdcH family protein n=1 Tax=Yoonia sp. 2307UL14-13 TaxID=3126506 RepID=UPI0030957F48
MTHTPHELAEEFPDQIERMHSLRETDGHFARMSDEYHALNRAVHRAETDVEPTSDTHMQQLRKARMKLKDEIYSYLKS